MHGEKLKLLHIDQQLLLLLISFPKTSRDRVDTVSKYVDGLKIGVELS